MKHELPALQFKENALEPYMTAETIRFHYGKHQKAYVDKLNTLVAGTPFENSPIETIIKYSSGTIYNNAAQAWNHAFLWQSLSPEKLKPTGALAAAIDKEFGSTDKFLQAFRNKVLGAFGSGWAWIVKENGRLQIETTHDGENLLRTDKRALLTIDLWEHAYYIDYRNDRGKYFYSFVNLINWDFAQKNFDKP